ncbi:sensor histidine kinase [Mesohalobacter salilacus]|uniref:sensor histidine kinase n=1 Tax=Mesohalobacter salilacus TaxID=2491711 RepID=UPI00403EE238
MKYSYFKFIVILMSLSLIGIIVVQAYWIKNSVVNSSNQFSISAKEVLINVADKIEKNELDSYYYKFLSLSDSLRPINSQVSELFKINEENYSTDYFIYTNSILREDYKMASPFLIGNKDSIEFRKYINKKVTKVVRNKHIDGQKQNIEQGYKKIEHLNDLERIQITDGVQAEANNIPIHNRINNDEINSLIESEIRKRNIDSDFEFGIYNDNLPTKVKSEDFNLNHDAIYGIPIFDYNEQSLDYKLYVSFTDKKSQILSSIAFMGGVSIIFTLIIVLAFAAAISQLIKQRQISQIKTDFINNMTHEFKTPIATINLALDSIKNPKIAEHPEMLKRYHKMIRDENKRMHAQVENVLRISKLEKNELDISKERLKLHDIIQQAITHVELIVKNREGYIKTHFDANKSSILANESHFTNVIVNMLDNAIKYSSDEPKIDIYTENVKNYIVVKIADQGSGMSNAVQKRIFEKFYREHTGDVHNVKGHGLGLAYVKQIVEDHHGEITVESEKGKGSTFIIKLPLIS